MSSTEFLSSSSPGGDPQQADVVVVGAGITGLTLALRLHQQGIRVVVVEAQSCPGGCISTRSAGGYRWEEGPNSFMPTPALLNLIAEVGLADQLLLADGKLPRFVYWEGELLPIPMSPGSLLGSRLLSIGGKLRALLGVLGFVGSPPGREESVEQFFRRQLGSEVVQRLVIPFVSGVYAGDAAQLSAAAAFARIADLEANYGSLLAGFWQAPRIPPEPISPHIQPRPRRGQLGNFRQGLQQLPEALAQRLGSHLHLNWRVTGIQPTHPGYLLQGTTPTGSALLQTRSLVLTVPAYVASPLLQAWQPDLADILGQIPYAPVAVVALGYPSDALPQPLRGFGHLIPRSQGLRTLGTIWASCLFEGRAPQGYHCFLNFIGGATDHAYARSRGIPPITALSTAQRTEIIHQELSQILLTRPADPQFLGERLWQPAIPQYTLGHRQRQQRIREIQAGIPGFFLCANYQEGVSLGDCVKQAERQASELMTWLKSST